MSVHELHIGTSGYSYNHWKYIFYPKGLAQAKWLPFYAEHYGTVEVNATFYRFFKRSVFEKWHDITPPYFQFTLKGPKIITREKRLKNVQPELDQFFAEASALREKFAQVLWQMPPSFSYNQFTLSDLQAFIQQLPRGMRHAFELRHRSWLNEEVYDLFNKEGIGWVSAHSSRFVSNIQRTGGFAYIRLHSPHQLYSSSYSDADLQQWAMVIKQYLEGGDVYCYFNNDFHGYALNDSERLKQFIHS